MCVLKAAVRPIGTETNTAPLLPDCPWAALQSLNLQERRCLSLFSFCRILTLRGARFSAQMQMFLGGEAPTICFGEQNRLRGSSNTSEGCGPGGEAAPA